MVKRINMMNKKNGKQFLTQAIDFVQKIASGDFSARMETSFKNDEIDALITGLNMLGEELQSRELEREKQTATIKESEIRFKELFDRMKCGVAVYKAIDNGEDFIFKDLNKAAEDIEQIKKDDVIGERLTKIFPDVSEFGLLEVLQKVWRTGKAQNYPAAFYKDDRIQGWRENHVYKLPRGEIVAVYDDVTEHMVMEKELRTSEEMFRNMSESVLDGLIMIDNEGSISFWNKAAQKIFGYSYQEVVGKDVHYLLAPQRFHEDYQKGFASFKKKGTGNAVGKIVQLEALKKDGTEFPIELSLSSLQLHGKWHAIGVVHDITQRKKIELEIKTRRKYLEGLLAAAPDAIVTIDEKGKIVEWSNGAEQMFGFTKNETIGYELDKLVTNVDTYQQASELTSKVMHNYNVKSIEAVRHSKDNTPVDVLISGSPIYDEDNLVGAIIIYTDISELKQSEAELKKTHKIYQKAIENARGVPYLLRFPEQKYEYFGSGFEKLLGIPPDNMSSDMWKKVCKQVIILDQNAPQNLKKYGESFLGKEIQAYRVDIEIETAAGETKWINDCSLPIIDEKSGKIVAALGILQDISDRKDIEKKLEKLLKEKEMLLKEVYHRVKNNFALVSSLLNLQSHSIKDKKALETLNTSRDRIQSMAMVHQQLYQSADLENINFKKYIESLTKTLFKSYVTDPSKILLEMKVENLPIGADLAIPCGLIINELATNAMKYAFDLSQNVIGKIIISFNQINDREVELVVQDNGKGLPDNFSIDETESLGLRIVKLLVQQINGSIDFQNIKGTKFIIKFSWK